MGNFYMESTQINYRRDEKLKTVDQKLQELSETSAIDTDIAPVFKSTNTYQPGDMVYYRNKLYVFNVEHTGTWAAADVTATDVTTELSSLKSGLINVDVALSVPEGTGKNVIPMTLAAVKAANTVGTWSGNAYTANDVTFTVQTDGDENIVGITANGTATQGTLFYLYKKGSDTSFPTNDYILTGCADGGSNSTWRIIGVEVESGSNVYFGDSGSGATFNTTATKYLNQLYIEVFSGVNISNKTFYPMVRYASVSDPTFAPYIPSVESRFEAVESGKQDKTDNTLTTATKTVVGAINELNGIIIHHDFSGPNTKEIITSLIAFIRDNTQTGHTYVLDGLFTDTTTTTTHYYNAVVTKMSSYVYGIVSYGNNIYNIDYLAGTYKTIMQFTGTAL